MLNLTQLLSFSNQDDNPHFRCAANGPPVVVWNLTKSCNLNCPFCYYDAGTKSGPGAVGNAAAAPYALARDVVKQIKQAKIRFVLLSGGEPLLYPKILDLIKSLTSSSIRVGISTNGTLIDEGLAARLKRCKVNYVGVSLDGLSALHNHLRGSPTAFKKATEGLRRAKDAGIKTGVRLTLNARNYKQLKDFFCFVETLNADRLCFYHLVYSGRAKDAGNDLTALQRQKTVKLIIELTVDWIKRKVPTQVLTVDNFSDAVMVLDYVRRESPQNYFFIREQLKTQGGCPAGKKILSINHEGYVYPCQFWQSYKLADLKKEKLGDVINNGRLFNGWREKLKGRCAACDYKDICGGCRVRAYRKYGNFWQEDPCCYINPAPRLYSVPVRRSEI